MRTRPAILTITILSVLLIGIVFYIFKTATSSKNKVLLQKRYTELKKSSTLLFENNNKLIENFVLDNTYDKDLLTAIASQNNVYLNNNFVPTLSSYDIDFFWVINSSMKLIAAKDADSKTIPFFTIDKNQLITALEENPYRNFYANINGTVTQLVIAPMDMSLVTSDEKLSKLYLICGKNIDSNYLNSLSEISTGAAFAINNKTVNINDTVNIEEKSICYNYSLLDIYGNTLAIVKGTKTLDEIKVYSNYLSNYSWLLLCFILLLLAGYYQFLNRKVLRPVDALSKALDEKDAVYLHKVKMQKDEFADMAQLIDISFKNNKKLKEEIELRIQSENELKIAAVNLENATVEKIRAEQDRLAKGDFLSTMSHEIRTPINGVIGIANLLKSEKLNADQQELVDTLLFSSNYLLSILSDILDFSKIETGNLTFDSVQFNIREVCKSVQALYSGNAKSKNLQLSVVIEDDVAEYLNGDSLRLCQMLNNLVGNAIKFTSSGHIQIKCAVVNEINNLQTIEFAVKDTGMGIPADKLETIFDSFSQADRTISTNYGGTGLGLTITKKLIELQGGKIGVSSKPGIGTTFTFTLAFEKVNLVVYKKDQAKQTNLNLNGLKVLVAEDNKINATILSKFLKKWNVKLDWVVNGQEAIEKLNENLYDIVLMDLHMPVMGGKQATKIIREATEKPYFNIPVIALTADATSETQKIILASGFNEYVTKPFNPDALYKVLEKYCEYFVEPN